MALIFSGGSLVALKQASPFPMRAMPATVPAGPLQLAYGSPDAGTYARVFLVQPEVRSVIAFLARSASSVRLHLYRRKSDTDRERVTNHGLARLLDQPLPNMSYYEWAERLFVDYSTFGEIFLLKIRNATGAIQALLPLSSARVTVTGGELATSFDYTSATGEVVANLSTDDVISMREWNPENPLRGASKLQSLTQVLSAEHAAVESRAAYWRNGARPAGLIELDGEQIEMTPTGRDDFMREWNEKFSGAHATGRVAMLESGMSYKELAALSAKDSEYVESRRLSREEAGAVYGVPSELIGGRTPSKEALSFFHRETLTSLLRRWQGTLQHALVPEYDSSGELYIEPNIEGKLSGAFAETSEAYRRAAGKPWMTVNEVRARNNMARIDDPSADTLQVPLYMGSEATSGGTDAGRKPGNVDGDEPGERNE